MAKPKILMAGLMLESNSFSPVMVKENDFTIFKGRQALKRFPVSDIFEGCQLYPTIFARSTPGGILEEESYQRFIEEIFNGLQSCGDIDGIWLYLHGAMAVENIGDGEGFLVSRLRKMVGDEVPIAVALDFHGNNSELLVQSANIICGYRTVPHTDAAATQRRAAKLLVKSLTEGVLPQAVMVKPPLMFPGEMVMTGIEPGKLLIDKSKEMINREGIWDTAVFCGDAWVDSPETGASVIVSGTGGEPQLKQHAQELAQYFWDIREQFAYEEETASVAEALQILQEDNIGDDNKPIFLTDTGDNVTAGAPGDSAYLLGKLIEEGIDETLVAGIKDSRVTDYCSSLKPGSRVKIELGAEINIRNNMPLSLSARLKTITRVLNSNGDDLGAAVVLNVAGIDVIVTENRYSFTQIAMYESCDVDIENYRGIIAKMGYLFDELRPLARRAIMVMSPGVASQDIKTLNYKYINRPLYPLAREFDWEI